MVSVSALIIAGVLVWLGQYLVRELRATRSHAVKEQALQIMRMLAPALASCAEDPRALLVWQPMAQTARTAFPDEFKILDAASGGTFPFSRDQLSAAHSRWTANWLAWELAHDSEFKLKTAAAAHDLSASGNSPVMRAKLDAVEHEKLETYQRRYEEYIRTAKALQALIDKG